MPALIEFPALRGAFPSLDVLQAALSIARCDEVQLSVEMAHRIIEACRGLVTNATRQLVDDALYLAGIVGLEKMQPLCRNAKPQIDSEQPVSDQARRLGEQLRMCRQKVDLGKLKKDREAGAISTREYLRREAAITSAAAPVQWANDVINAIAARDLETILRVVDNPGNATTMRFLEEEYGVNLLKQPSRQRRAAACRLMGLQCSEEAQAAVEAVERRRKERAAQRDADRLLLEMESARIQFEGRETNWKDVINELIARGYTSVESRQAGATKRFMLMNPITREFIALSAKRKTLAYARQALQRLSKVGVDAQEAV